MATRKDKRPPASSAARGPVRARSREGRVRDDARRARNAADGGSGFSASPGGRYRQARPSGSVREGSDGRFTSRSVAELRRADRAERMRKASRRHLARIAAVVGVVVALAVGGVVLYNSPAFTIKNVEVNGVTHLTSAEMSQLAAVPSDTTLLRVDTGTIAKRLAQNAWVEDVQVNRVFPDTLQINVTERAIAAVVEVPTSSGRSVKQWAIADDHVWLMPIPDAESDAAKTTSAQIYEDAAAALHIVDVPYGTQAEIGEVCTDPTVNNALDIVSGMTTELASRVVEVSAAGTAETTLVLDSGVEIAFGKAEDIRDKERVILEILAQNPDNVAYINVRMVETPTWRAI